MTTSTEAAGQFMAAAARGAVDACLRCRPRTAAHRLRGLLTVPGFLGFFALLAAAPLQAADVAERFQAECFACHGEEMYTRSDRRVNSRAALEKRVLGCTKAVGGSWSATEIDGLVELLNTRYYRLP